MFFVKFDPSDAALDFASEGGYYVRAAASACVFFLSGKIRSIGDRMGFFLSGKIRSIGDRMGIKLPKELEELAAANTTESAR